MKTLFNASFYRNNRTTLNQLFKGTAPIVMSANGLLQQNSDMTYPFRQDSSFWYLTGINVPGAILVIDKSTEYVILPKRGEHEEIFDVGIDLDRIRKQSGIETILGEDEGWRQLGNKLKRAKHVATLAASPEFIDEYGFYTNPARAKMLAKLKTYNENLDLLDLREHITRMRLIKQPQELEAIEKAIAVTRQTIKQIKRNLKKYKFEFEIEADILSSFMKHGTKAAFNCIVASGKNASVIHYMDNNSKINQQDLILLDIGAEVEYYSSDISRTLSINHRPSKRQRQIYEAVVDVQNYAFSLVKPGISLRDMEAKIEHYMGEKLRVLGLISSIEKESVRKYYPHGTSHFLGLDTHDVGFYDKPLAPGMVITVEPGMYVPEENIGVRIEDDVLLTEDGYRLLTSNLPSLIN